MFDDQRRSFRLHFGKRCAPVLTIAAIAIAAPLTAQEVTVRRGDTLGGISSDTGVPVARIAAYNGIRNPNLIIEGQVIRIPPAEGDVEYVVLPGDTLGAIARRYDSTVAALVARNGVADANRIIAGRTLVIPGPGAAPEPAPTDTPAPTTAAPAPTTTAAPAPAAAPTAAPTTPAPTTAAPTTAAPTTAPPTTPAPTAPPTTPAPTAAPTTAAPTTPTPPPGVVVSTIWLIQEGDTVTSIAGKVGVTPARLAEANNIAVGTPLVAGRYLFVPQR